MKKIIGIIVLVLVLISCGSRQEVQEEVIEYKYRKSSDLDTIKVDWWYNEKDCT